MPDQPNDTNIPAASPPLAGHYTANFKPLQRAFADGNVALMSCTDKATGKARAVICAVQFDPDNGEY